MFVVYKKRQTILRRIKAQLFSLFWWLTRTMTAVELCDTTTLFGISLETNTQTNKKISLDLGNILKRTHCWSMICLLEHYPPLLTNPQNSHLVEEHVGPQHELEIRRRLLAIFKLIPIERIWRGIKLLINSWWISLINWPRSTTAQQASHWFSWPQLKPS